MKLVDDNKVVMTKRELAGILLQNEKFTELAGELLRRKPLKKKEKPVKKASMGRKNLRITDHQEFKLLRVAPEFSDRDTTHGKILNCWAMLPDATASVKRLLGYLGYTAEGKEFHHCVINEVENPLAWIRQTIKQALLRGDAEDAGDSNTEITSKKETTESSPLVAFEALNTSNGTEHGAGEKLGEGFGVSGQNNELKPVGIKGAK